jgi:LysR family transcriptional regulator, transcriptional activator of nhaA
MKTKNLNFRHLYYFWVVAKEGGISRAAERLGVAVQTISMQLAQLEQDIGKSLLAPKGRRLVLTEAGQIALGYADQIFLLGEQMQETLAEDDVGSTMRLTVGISDSLPKLTAYRLMEAALSLPKRVRVACYDGKYESLLADLALHKFDVVLTDRPVSSGSSLRVFSHPLGECPVALFGVPELADKYTPNFPASLNGAPMLLPTRNNAIRDRLDQWFERQNVRPDIVGEFEDSALLKTFGRNGMGLFPAPSALALDIKEQFHSVQTGHILDISDQFFAISTEMKIRHPAVEAILSAPFKPAGP